MSYPFSKTSELPWVLKAAAGLIPGVTVIQKFGRNAAVPATGTGADIWTGGGDYPFPTEAKTIRIAAGHVDDNPSGSGSRAVTVEGLDEDWNEVSIVLATNGSDPGAASAISLVRVNRAFCEEDGTYGGSNVGLIQIETADGAVVLARIEAGIGQTEMAIWTVPSGKTAFLARMLIAVGETNKEVDISVLYREDADVTTAPFGCVRTRQFFDSIVSGPPAVRRFEALPVLEARSDIWIRGKTPTSTAVVDTSFDLWILDSVL